MTVEKKTGAPAVPFAGVREHHEGECAAVKRLGGGALLPFPLAGLLLLPHALVGAHRDQEEWRGSVATHFFRRARGHSSECSFPFVLGLGFPWEGISFC